MIFGQSSCLINNKVYLYGGNISEESDSTPNIKSNECLTYDTITKQLHTIQYNESSLIPPATYFHSCVSYQDRYMIIYGGKIVENNSCNELICMFDTVTNEWNVVQCSEVQSISGRYGHCAVVIGNEMIVFGGTTEHVVVCNDLLAFHLVTHTWRVINLFGEVPIGRFHHTVNVLASHLIVFGGMNIKNEVLSDLYCINAETGGCHSIQTESIINPIYGHVSFLEDSVLHIIGGSSNGSELHRDYALSIQIDDRRASVQHRPQLERCEIEYYSKFSTLCILNDGSVLLYGGIPHQYHFSISDIPDDIAFIILSYLDRATLCDVACVSKSLQFSKLSNDNSIWEPIFKDVINSPCYDSTLVNKLQYSLKSDTSNIAYKQAVIELELHNMYSRHRYIGEDKIRDFVSNVSGSKRIQNLYEIPDMFKVVCVGPGLAGKV
jgi:N-acetylneuraminic acid mutarotase